MFCLRLCVIPVGRRMAPLLNAIGGRRFKALRGRMLLAAVLKGGFSAFPYELPSAGSSLRARASFQVLSDMEAMMHATPM